MKKGFTLMELLITIALLSIIGTVIVSNMSRTLENEQNRQIDFFKSRLEKAACVYADINDEVARSAGSVTVGKLLEQGLVKEEELYNPETQQNIIDSNPSIIIRFFADGSKKCCYSNDRCSD